MVCDVLVMLCTCNNVLPQCFCNNVSVISNHMIVTGCRLIGGIACNKLPVLLLLFWMTDHHTRLRGIGRKREEREREESGRVGDGER